jgi:hypothetical protein
MQGGRDPYGRMEMCPCAPDDKGKRSCLINDDDGNDAIGRQPRQKMKCRSECKGDQLFCLARTRFHLALAQLGKTPLTKEERQWLAPNDIDGGDRLISLNIQNPIFIYEQTQLNDDTFWEGLADFVGVSHLPNTHYQGSKGKQHDDKDICLPIFDYFRSLVMEYSYQLSHWLLEYFLPLAKDPERTGVTVSHLEQVTQIVASSYQHDPCRRLILEPGSNGKYILNPALDANATGMFIPTPEWIEHQNNLTEFYQRQKKEEKRKRRKNRSNRTNSSSGPGLS